MCGIAGYVNFDEAESLAQEANRCQAHRGPDHQGTWRSDPVVFAHQRLSIIDLSERSNQPFVKEGLAIVFNGEIYNYAALRKELESNEVRFVSQGDTEVVLELYRQEGVRCLDRLIGMFAFAIYETASRKLLLVRDPFGIKPLFLYADGARFAFASELKTLTRVPGFRKTLNMTSLVGAANYLWVPGNECIFSSVTKLSAGHYAVVDCSRPVPDIALTPYFRLNPVEDSSSEEEMIEKMRWHLEQSVARHMVADVPVSSFLSGGLDSSVISVIAGKYSGRLSTYTIATSDKDKKVEQMPADERYARLVAEKFGFNHSEIKIDAGIVDLLPTMARILDEPLADPAAINVYLICRRARELGVKVLLSGMGADEIFFGYRRQRAALLAMRYRSLPRGIRNLTRVAVNALPVRIGSRGVKVSRWGRRFLQFAENPMEAGYRRSYSYYDTDELTKLFHDDVSGPVSSVVEQHAAVFNGWPEGDLINQVCHTDIELFMQGLNLTYTDRASMAASVEVRVPFIDREMIQFAMSVPGRLKYQKGEGKYILKKAAEKYLPREIVYRPKASFGAPIRSWISNELRPLVDDLLSESVVRRRGLFRYEKIRSMIDEDRSGAGDFAYQLYFLLTLEFWMREYIDK